MSTKKIKEAIKEAREKLVKTLKENPDNWEYDKTTSYNGNNPVRVFFDKRNDGQNPEMLVLEQPEWMGTCNEIDIPFLLEHRFVHENRNISPNMGRIISAMQEGVSEMNTDLMSSIVELESNLRVYRDNVLDSHKIQWYSMEDNILENVIERIGIDSSKDKNVISKINDKINMMKDPIQIGAREVLMHYTMADGTSPLQSAKQVVNNLFTESTTRRRIEERPESEGLYRGFESAINEVLKEEGYTERLSFPALRSIDEENEMRAVNEMSENDPLLKEMMSMFEDESNQEKPKQEVKESKKRRNNRPS